MKLDEVSRQWAELKATLRRKLGPRGTAEWLKFAAEQEERYADRVERPIEQFPASGMAP